ncbi:MAG TPA: glycosyltransferase [Vicinamibacteria bacterium]|nr:glycosyltransferase [Vicinamibacteria bacterium]
MQVHQMMAALSFGDAIGNEALRIQEILRGEGFDSEIFAESVHPQMAGRARKLWDYREASSKDGLLILHFSIGAGVSTYAYHLPDPILLVYHNITPARWFQAFHRHLAGLCYHGRRELEAFVPRVRLAVGDSEFNRSELEAVGFHPTGVLPLLLDPSRLSLAANEVVLEMFDDDKTNFLFVGRIIPNKCFHDLIKVFAFYQRYIDRNSRLLLVGEWVGFEKYYEALVRMVDELALKDVVFTGHVDDDDLVAYYEVADLFLCLSEHEGYCVPLVEAFELGVPVMALDAGAVRETLGGAGVLIREKRIDEIAMMAHAIVTDEELSARIVEGQDLVLERMAAVDHRTLLLDFVQKAMQSPQPERSASDPPSRSSGGSAEARGAKAEARKTVGV